MLEKHAWAHKFDLTLSQPAKHKILPAFRKGGSHGCEYEHGKGISHMQQYANSIWAELTQTVLANTAVGYLHIRRGDTTNMYNTSLAAMQDYVTCSFKGTESPGSFCPYFWPATRKAQNIAPRYERCY
jgi:hypothetical protein